MQATERLQQRRTARSVHPPTATALMHELDRVLRQSQAYMPGSGPLTIVHVDGEALQGRQRRPKPRRHRVVQLRPPRTPGTASPALVGPGSVHIAPQQPHNRSAANFHDVPPEVTRFTGGHDISVPGSGNSLTATGTEPVTTLPQTATAAT